MKTHFYILVFCGEVNLIAWSLTGICFLLLTPVRSHWKKKRKSMLKKPKNYRNGYQISARHWEMERRLESLPSLSKRYSPRSWLIIVVGGIYWDDTVHLNVEFFTLFLPIFLGNYKWRSKRLSNLPNKSQYSPKPELYILVLLLVN